MSKIVGVVAGLLAAGVAGAILVQQPAGTGGFKPTKGVTGPGTKPLDLEAARKKGNDLAMIAAGCFWCIENDYRQLDGVVATAVGYSGGRKENPTYKEVCTDTTGHAEVVLIEFNPKKISYETILRKFFSYHDPTQLNRQGPDVGTQYRSAIFTYDDAQRKTAQTLIAELTKLEAFPRPIVTEVTPASKFWMAEEYHQQYYNKMGIGARN